MIFKLANWVLVLLACQTVLASADDDYFKKAVFRALKAKDGQFSSQVNYVVLSSKRGLTRNYTYGVEEKHSFKLNTGNVKEGRFFYFMRSNESAIPWSEVIYINGSEFYDISLEIKGCFSRPFDNFTIMHEVRRWSPRRIFNQDYPYELLGELLVEFKA